MTTKSKTANVSWSGDRLSVLSVILLALVALVAGWFLKAGVENRSQAFTTGSISANIPTGWLELTPAGNEVLHLTDRTPGGYGTTYLIETKAVPTDADPGQVAGLLTLERGTNLTAYRVLNQQGVLIQGQEAIEIDYVYVESAANLSHAVVPAVVRGVDYIFVKNGQAVIVGYRADQSNFDTDLGRFYRFLVSVRF